MIYRMIVFSQAFRPQGNVMALDLVKSFTFCILLCSGIYALQFSTNPLIITSVGSRNESLTFSWTTEAGEHILSVGIKMYNKSANGYVEIASFVPSTSSTMLTTYGEYLRYRVSLMSGTNQFGILYNDVRCEDDNKYICTITVYIPGRGTPQQNSRETHIQVNSNPTKPENITSDSVLNNLEIGDNVTFVCQGNVGKPVGGFVWKKYIQDGQVLTVNSSTQTSTVPENCTFYGTSNLTIQVTDRDNNASMSCMEESHNTSKEMAVTIGPLNVYYPVKDVKISRNPFKEDYIQGVHNQVSLTCIGNGNPMPHNFLWYKEEDIFCNLTTENTLILSNLSLNDSGNYTCVMFNSFNGQMYNSTAKTELTVLVPGRTTTPPINTHSDASGPTTAEIIIVVLIVAAFIFGALAIIYCLCGRRRKDKSRVYNVGNFQRSYEGQDPHTNYDNLPLVFVSKSKPKSDNYTETDIPSPKNEEVVEMSYTGSVENKLEDTKAMKDDKRVDELNDEYATVQKRPIKQDQDNRLIDNSKFSDHELNDEYATVQKRPIKQDQENRLIDNSKSVEPGTSENPGKTQKSDLVDRNSLEGLDEQIKQLDQTKGHDNQDYEQDEELLISEETQTKEGDIATEK